MEPVINYQAWEQLRLLPPSAMTVEIRLYLSGENEEAQIGWKVSETDSDELIEIGIHRPIPIDLGLKEGLRLLTDLYSRSRDTLSPF